MATKTFFVEKMRHEGEPELVYFLGETRLNDFIGQEIELTFTGRIQCVNCGRSIKKTFNQGYCFPCFQKLAACDLCVLKPELCHYKKGTCREPSWGEEHCLIDHFVYLANTAGLKVGLTRAHKTRERWGDQGAVAAILFAKVPERYLAGLFEVELRAHISDRTDWRKLVKGEVVEVDLLSEKQRLKELISGELKGYLLTDPESDLIRRFSYPIKSYPAKAISWNPEKEPTRRAVLNGIRGQYLLLGEEVLNVRKFGGYEVSLVV